MRSRVLALFLAMVFGLVGHWPAVAGQAPAWVLAATGLAAPNAQDGAEHPRAAGSAAVSGLVTGLADEPAPVPNPEPAHPTESLAETWNPSWAEGASDLPALFLADPRAHAPTATMAPPRPHAAAAWRRLYPSVPLRPPRALPATA